MRKLIIVMLVCVTANHSTVLAAEPSNEHSQNPNLRATSLAPGWLAVAAAREVTRLTLPAPSTKVAVLPVQQQGQQKRSWIGRHPVLVGTLVGFGAGFVIGYLPGDDGVLDDFTAGFNGLVLGGVGAGTGALMGAVASAATK